MTAIRLVLAINDALLLAHVSTILGKDETLSIIPFVMGDEFIGRQLN